MDTTDLNGDTAGSYPPLRMRRLIARVIDSAIAFGLACLIVLPFTLNQATDALLLGGFDSFRELLTEWDLGSVPGDSSAVALEQLQPVVLTTIYLQALIIWAYDWLSLTLTGSSIGKMITRVRVTRHHGDFEPTFAPDLGASRSWVQRVFRMALRAGLVVGPPALAAGMLLAAAFAVPGAVELAELFIALSVVLFIVWLAGGVGLHGLATGTRVVGFEWQQLKQEAGRQLEYHTGHADDYLHKLQEAARTAGVQRAAHNAADHPRARSAMAQGRTVAEQVEQAEHRGRGDRALLPGLGSPTDAKDSAMAAARRLREAYRDSGWRGVLDSVTQSPPGPDGPDRPV